MGHLHKTVSKSLKPTISRKLNVHSKLEIKDILNTTLVILFLLLISIQTPSLANIDFCYEQAGCGPKTWEGMCKSGRKQSPINIVASRVKIRLQSTRIVLNRNYIGPKNFFMQNNGHTVIVSLTNEQTSKCYLFGDGLGKKPYYFSQLHFHWGANIREGSEHRISGKRFPLEMHMLHKQVKNPLKIAVVAVLFYISPRDNPRFGPIIRNLGKVLSTSEEPVAMPQEAKITLTSLLPKRMRMFRYVGSLTTPPCTENVVWTVFQDPLPISRRQLAAFRKLLDVNGEPMKRTFRPTQPLYNRRNIYFLRQLRRRALRIG